MIWPVCKCGCLALLTPAAHTNRSRGVQKGVCPNYLVGHGRCGISVRPGNRRVCRTCGHDRPIEEFEEYREGLRRHRCRRCVGERRSERLREDPALRERAHERYLRRDPELERERLRALEKRPDQRKKRRERNRANAASINARNRSYRARNRQQSRERSRRAARLRRLGYDKAMLAWTEVLARDPCSYCGGESTGIDHVTPLADGGENEVANFTGACFGCNRQKRTQPLLLFLASRFLMAAAIHA